MTTRRKWTRRQLDALGVVTDLKTLGSVFGMSETSAREAHKAGTLPEPIVVLRVGRRLIVPVAGILCALGLADSAPDDRQHLQPGPAGDESLQAMPAPGRPLTGGTAAGPKS
jgi:hypothetical protein